MPTRSQLNALAAIAPATTYLAQRDVPEKISETQIERDIPVTWKEDSVLWQYVTNKYGLRGSGVGFVTSPYTQYWDLIWGVTPIEDLPKYKELYTFTPYIKAAIDVTVNLAMNQFELTGSKDEVREWLSDWLDEHNILYTLRILATDMIVFGTSYCEICRDEDTNEIVYLKPLDPVWMRPRTDAFGNTFGYIQLLTVPPVAFTSHEVMCFKWGAKSWWYEAAYGTSLLRPLLRIQAMINQFEDDMATIVHTYTKPMLVVKGGQPDKPMTDPEIAALMSSFQDRQVATDVFVRGDVAVDVIPSMTRGVNVQFWLDYLYKQREAVLGVPKIFLGESEGTNRATSDTVMQEYVTRLRMLQTIIGEMLETELFKQLIDTKFGEGVEIPEVAWKPIWEAKIEDKAKFAQGLVATGIITVVEARTMLGFPEKPPQGTGELPAQPTQVQPNQPRNQLATTAE